MRPPSLSDLATKADILLMSLLLNAGLPGPLMPPMVAPDYDWCFEEKFVAVTDMPVLLLCVRCCCCVRFEVVEAWARLFCLRAHLSSPGFAWLFYRASLKFSSWRVCPGFILLIF